MKQELKGRYKILSPLSEGGFGSTYLAEDPLLPGNAKCVVKQLKSMTGETLSIARKLFEREATMLFKLNHPQIPRLFAYFEEEEEFYLVQEYIEGLTLRQKLISQPQLSQTQVIKLVVEVLQILDYVHQQKVIHRDIKPANLIERQSDGKLVLIDFGAVTQIKNSNSSEQDDSSRTVAIGSLGYTPREQEEGNPKPNSDLYALAMTAIQALTGKHPRDLTRDPETSLVQWRNFTEVSDTLAQVLDKMAHPFHRDRYSCATQALQDLAAISGDIVTYSSPIQPQSELPTQIKQDSEKPTQVINPGNTTFHQPTLTKPKKNRFWVSCLSIIVVINIITIIGEIIYPIIRPSYYIYRAEQILEQKPELALEYANKAINFNSNNWKAWEERGEALFILERYDAAMSAFDKALQLQPNEPKILHEKAKVLIRENRYQEALDISKKALHINQKDTEAWNTSGLAYIGLNNYNQAIISFDKAKEIDPRNPIVWQSKGIALEALQQKEDANKIYQEALATYDESLRMKPDDAVKWVDRGFVLGKLGRLDEALKSYEKAIKLDPNFATAWLSKGNILRALKKSNQALEAYQQVIKLRPSSYEAWHNKGAILASDFKQYDDAIISFNMAIKQRPKFHDGWIDKGYALLDKYFAINDQRKSENNYLIKEAIKCFSQANQLEPKDNRSLLGLGMSYSELQQYDLALKYYDQAITINPKDPFAWANRADLAEKMGNRDIAIKSYQEVLQIDPSFPGIAENLKRLQN